MEIRLWLRLLQETDDRGVHLLENPAPRNQEHTAATTFNQVSKQGTYYNAVWTPTLHKNTLLGLTSDSGCVDSYFGPHCGQNVTEVKTKHGAEHQEENQLFYRRWSRSADELNSSD